MLPCSKEAFVTHSGACRCVRAPGTHSQRTEKQLVVSDVVWFTFAPSFWYSQVVLGGFEEDFGSKVVFWFDAGHVPDHSPLPVPFCKHCVFHALQDCQATQLA